MNILQRLLGKREAPVLPGAMGADLHSHVIPGIDDGAATIEDSLDMLRAFAALGFRKVITTPHIMRDGYPNTPARIREGLARVNAAAAQAGIAVQVEAAAEYYLDEAFMAGLEGEVMTFGGTKRYVLFETSYITKPLSLNDTIFRLNALKYTPVMAHPERYQYFWNDEGVEQIQLLRERGLKMQVNIGSFGGRYSKWAATIARDMAKQGLIDFLGSDMHRARQADTIRKSIDGSKELRALLTGGHLLNREL